MKFSKSSYRTIGLQAFSLFLAVIAWFYIYGILESSKSGPAAYKDLKGVEVKLMGEPVMLGNKVFAIEMGDKSVDIRVKGPEQELEKISPMDIVAYIDVSGLRPGRTYSPVVKIILPHNIEMVGAEPLVRVDIKDKNL